MDRLNPDDATDPLASLFASVRIRSTIFCRSELGAPWGFSVNAREIATFHFVDHGRCWLEVAGIGQQTALDSGDFVVLPHGHAHAVRDAPDSRAERLEDMLAASSPVDGELRAGGPGTKATILCGGFILEQKDAIPFLAALPPVLHLKARADRVGGWLRLARDVLTDPAISRQPAENAMLCRAADLVFVEAVRTHLAQLTEDASGWLGALRDPGIARAINLIHADLRRSWTVGTLASAVGMSRTAFAVRFSTLLGQSPMRYLAARRIANAKTLLNHDTLTLSRVATEVGYESDAAFGRAFKRHVGLSPAEYRRQSARDSSPPSSTIGSS